MLQVPSVSVEMETLSEFTCGKNGKKDFHQLNLPSSKTTFKVGLKRGHRIKIAFKGKFMLCNTIRLTVRGGSAKIKESHKSLCWKRP